MRFHVRGVGNADYRKLLARLIGEIPFKKRRNGLSVDDQDRIQIELILQTILLGWEGFEDAPYSPEVARSFVSDPGMVQLRDGILYAANIVSERNEEAAETTSGNSSSD